MSLLLGQDEAVAHVVGAGLGQRIEPPFTGMGIVAGGALVGGFVFNDYNGANVELTAYAPGLLRRGHLVAIANYAFGQLGCRRISARAHRRNKRSLRTLTKAGFRCEGTAKHYYPDGDAILYAMLRDNCRWFRP